MLVPNRISLKHGAAMILKTRPTWLRYLAAVLITLAALSLRFFLVPLTGTGAPFILFFGAVIISSLYGGIGPGLVTTLLSAPLAAYFFILQADYLPSQAFFQALLFVVESLLVAWMSASLQQAKRKAERLLDEANRATRMRDDLVAMVSHDLKNPLSAIDLAVTGMVRSFRESAEDNAKLLQQAEFIKISSSRMKKLVDDLLDLAKMDTGHFSVELAPCPDYTIIKEVLDLLGPLARQKAIGIEIDPSPTACTILCDKDRILQVLSNLIGNAIKFTPEGGLIQVRIRPQDKQVRFEISDTGPGIPEEQIPHLFDRYWQAKQTQRHGTGLGLSIAKGIINAHGGKIWVESRVGEGSTFYFTLSRSEAGSTSVPSRPRY
jgi:signal transduction histidine kinase